MGRPIRNIFRGGSGRYELPGERMRISSGPGRFEVRKSSVPRIDRSLAGLEKRSEKMSPLGRSSAAFFGASRVPFCGVFADHRNAMSLPLRSFGGRIKTVIDHIAAGLALLAAPNLLSFSFSVQPGEEDTEIDDRPWLVGQISSALNLEKIGVELKGLEDEDPFQLVEILRDIQGVLSGGNLSATFSPRTVATINLHLPENIMIREDVRFVKLKDTDALRKQVTNFFKEFFFGDAYIYTHPIYMAPIILSKISALSTNELKAIRAFVTAGHAGLREKIENANLIIRRTGLFLEAVPQGEAGNFGLLIRLDGAEELFDIKDFREHP